MNVPFVKITKTAADLLLKRLECFPVTDFSTEELEAIIQMRKQPEIEAEVNDGFFRYRVVFNGIGTGYRIAQIKFVRQITGWGLKEAKDKVDAAHELNARNPQLDIELVSDFRVNEEIKRGGLDENIAQIYHQGRRIF